MNSIFQISINLNTATEEEINRIFARLKKDHKSIKDKVGVDFDPSKTSSTRNPAIDWNELPNLNLSEKPIDHPHYDNKNGSLYKIASDLNLNAYEFDILKRIARCRKKGQFKEDLQKIKDTVDLYLKEHKQ